MSKFWGKICPYCKSEIKKNDVFVVCSQCEMPHHKDCWVDNRGCTTFGCAGTISAPEEFEDRPQEDCEIVFYEGNLLEPEPVRFCPVCGTRNVQQSVRCAGCGAMLQPTAPAAQPFGQAQPAQGGKQGGKDVIIALLCIGGLLLLVLLIVFILHR